MLSVSTTAPSWWRREEILESRLQKRFLAIEHVRLSAKGSETPSDHVGSQDYKTVSQ